MTTKPDISVVIPGHHEGILAHRTIKSVLRSIEYIEDRNLTAEIVVVLDDADEETRNYFDQYKSDYRFSIFEVEYKDLGLTRNFGAKKAKSELISFVDADNLTGGNWFYKTIDFSRKLDTSNFVLHPEYLVAFERISAFVRMPDPRDSSFEITKFVEHNYWDSVCVTHKEVLEKVPYVETRPSNGFGPEDWHWNCETLANGIEHFVVEGTVYFRREKYEGSLWSKHVMAKTVLPPSTFFESKKFEELINKYTIGPNE